MNKILSLTHIPPAMLEGRIRPTVKSSSGTMTDSQIYRPVMNSTNFLKMSKYLLLPHLEKNFKRDQRQFLYRNVTGCLDVITLLKETVAHYNREPTDVHCTTVDLSKAYHRINKSSLCHEIKATYLPGQIVNLMGIMGKTNLFAAAMKDILAMYRK